MRVSKAQLAAIDSLAERFMGGKRLTFDDLKTATLHVRWLSGLGEKRRAANWHRLYSARFAKFGLKLPPAGSDLRSVTSPINVRKAGGRPPSGRRPSYCTHPEKTRCCLCPLSFGAWWDCTGRPVSGSFGVSVKGPDGEEVRIAKPADGKRVRGCYFQGGTVYTLNGPVVVPKGTSVAHVMQRLGRVQALPLSLGEGASGVGVPTVASHKAPGV